MSINAPNFENSIPQGSLNRAHYIGNILSEVFGIQSPVYVANAWFKQPGVIPAGYQVEELAKNQLPGDYQVELLPEEETEYTSQFGTPVMGIVQFEGGNYNNYNKYTGKVQKGIYATYRLPYSCIVDFSRENNVITTPVLGGTGTVKELYGIGDWEINISGIAFTKGDIYGNSAHQIISQLVGWADICDAIDVSGEIFFNKGISRIVIKSLSVQPIVAKYNVIPFQIQAVSDEPIELMI